MLKYKVGDEVYYIGVMVDHFGENVTVLEIPPRSRTYPYRISLSICQLEKAV